MPICRVENVKTKDKVGVKKERQPGMKLSSCPELNTHKKAPFLFQLVSLHLGHFVPLQNGLSNEPVYGAEYNKVHLDHDS